MKRFEIRVDVSSVLPFPAPMELAATIVVPDTIDESGRPIVIFGVPGGGYGRRYFDLDLAGHEGYSEAAYHAERGMIFIALDHLGVGESSQPDPTKIDYETLATSYAYAVNSLSAGLRDGSLVDGLPALSDLFAVGIGQSMGGAVTILTQGRLAPFDAIGVFGYSAFHTVIPQPTTGATEAGIRRFDDLAPGKYSDPFAPGRLNIDYIWPFHWEDVPAEIVAMDTEGGYPQRRTSPSFGSLSMPHCAVQMMLPGAVEAEAAAITVPVFVGVGARDTSPDPHREPAAYPNSPDISLMVVPTMAHMHNFASTREVLWQRTSAWACMVAGAARLIVPTMRGARPDNPASVHEKLEEQPVCLPAGSTRLPPN
ncbi:alpha/beta hydrolase [Novosphingobium sp. G106]|uniref:alpha/beta hydrolase n=1 Tax=Novosphingobium sp. G106 TaxID=2849500 RepID=UPI001C2CFB50|nr:alpha/beta hydrolase [Novosphingobium sp. G106]MBV1688970.1 alpha/beta hydrolase [Novosphingobium sp. G106]